MITCANGLISRLGYNLLATLAYKTSFKSEANSADKKYCVLILKLGVSSKQKQGIPCLDS